jgi:hypothetical protein
MEYLVPIQLNSEFPSEIEKIVQDKQIEYMEAVILWCENNGLEIEFAGELIRRNAVLKSKIQFEAENLNFMKKSARLPI